MINKAYLEITNVCNLDCSFCHKTRREKRFLSTKEFDLLTDKLNGKIKYLYLHLLGEPLLHPQIADFLEIAHKKGFRVILTTNGTLLDVRKEILLGSQALFKISISLHSHEANAQALSLEQYLQKVVDFVKSAKDKKKICALRLWNIGGENEQNDIIISTLKSFFPGEWAANRNGYKLTEYIFLEEAEKFDWPDISRAEENTGLFCHGLRDQIGILCDGTVVPCCLDADGEINLGNLFESTFEQIVSSPRAKSIYDGFTARKPYENLCRRCPYAKRFSK